MPEFLRLLHAAKALVGDDLALEALAAAEDGTWLRELGRVAVNFGSRRLHTAGFEGTPALWIARFWGTRVTSIAQCRGSTRVADCESTCWTPEEAAVDWQHSCAKCCVAWIAASGSSCQADLMTPWKWPRYCWSIACATAHAYTHLQDCMSDDSSRRAKNIDMWGYPVL